MLSWWHAPSELLSKLNEWTGGGLSQKIGECVDAKLEASLFVGADPKRPSDRALVVIGIDTLGNIKYWHQWPIAPSDYVGNVYALRLRVEGALHSARRFRLWGAEAKKAALARKPLPPRPDKRKYQ
jgi:hypothetical protein